MDYCLGHWLLITSHILPRDVITCPCSIHLYTCPYNCHSLPRDLGELRQDLRQREKAEWGPRRRTEVLRRLDTIVASHTAHCTQQSKLVLKDEIFHIKDLGRKSKRVSLTGKFVPHPPTMLAATGPKAESVLYQGKFIPQPPQSKPSLARRAPRCLRDALLRRNFSRAMSGSSTAAEGGDKITTMEVQQFVEDTTGLPAVETIPSCGIPNQEELPSTKRLLLRRPQADKPGRMSPVTEKQMPLELHMGVEQKLTKITRGVRPKELTACNASSKRRRSSTDVLSVTTPADAHWRFSTTGDRKSAQPRCAFQGKLSADAQTNKPTGPDKIVKDKRSTKRNLRYGRKGQSFLPDINKK